MFEKILIANRGEIACRVIKTARAMGVKAVAVYSDADARALHVKMADEAVRLGPPPARESYLHGDLILAAARATGAQAIHPGYGFLSENEDFARACAAAGIVFIGPSPEAIHAMGLKDRAKAIMQRAGVPVVPGYWGAEQNSETLKSEAGKIGYPVLIKAVAGGGGKGMRLVERAEDFVENLAACQREAQSSFANAHVMIEKYIAKPRHIEMQVFGDSHGNAVHLFERDCSLQRRHQKVVEEAPAPHLPAAVRAKLGDAAVQAVKAIGYTNAGTIEFIMDSTTHEFYFMEMNTRLQVEHPVTEMITGFDLVEWQLRVAAGEALPCTQSQIKATGHAFEVRLYAEDPANNFLPQTGRLECFIQPPAARLDTGIAEGDSVTIFYDPLIAKLIVHAADRAAAIAAMRAALEETAIAGLTTNQEFLGNIFAHPAFATGEIDTGFLARHEKELLPMTYGLPDEEDLIAAALFTINPSPSGRGRGPCEAWEGEGVQCESVLQGTPSPYPLPKGEGFLSGPWQTHTNWRLNNTFTRTLNFRDRLGATHSVTIAADDNHDIPATVIAGDNKLTVFRHGRVIPLYSGIARKIDTEKNNGRITAPMPGRIVAIMVKPGDTVTLNQPLLTMEAMKMELTLRAPIAGKIQEVPVAVNQQVSDGALLAAIQAEGNSP